MSVKSNNRFLQRVNPQITRGLADGGSSLNHSEIQTLARQMVDMGLWHNLIFWVHEGLVKERISGSNVFVPKIYDISDTPIDMQQTDTTKQVKLLNGFVFDGINDNFIKVTTPSKLKPTQITTCFYCNLINNGGFESIIDNFSATPTFVRYHIFQRADKMRVQIFAAGGQKQYATVNNITNGWVFFATTYINNNLNLYLNGSAATVSILNNATIGDLIYYTNNEFAIGINLNATTNNTKGTLSDLRIFNNVLTDTEIDAIFQETRGKYGI